MDLTFIYEIIGIASFVIAGVNFIVIVIAKTFWKLTFEKKQQDDEKRFQKIEITLEKLNQNEEKNKFFRHNFNSVTKSLESLISSEIKHFSKLIEVQIQNILEKINEKK